ncbi:peptidyl-prolyl cis-trans isomerase [Roseovarius rhodophyticola]|uniref:Peptidyl-prolyl cis-trans isomerase n=1 Tax=Roseovarius rhodophyticola TaxID=3080827 RepID=A0ABZ2TGE0_9RHOB|nr:peptidyl-prolyl cis-trans isomerase [Roseovarius sp. W115]MDV2928409.1 peptidyl-prolyl cis-trans isomerase [Roseovarius sp. W115]
MASKSITKPLVWILMGLLILGLGGFGVTSLSGTLRSVGKVGEADIRVDEYFRGLQQEINALQASRGEPVSFIQASAEGVPERVLSQLISQAAFDHEMISSGVSVGDEAIGEQILAMPQFRGGDGEFNREAYRFTLEQAGLSERDFEESMRRDTARSFLQASVLAGVTLPDAYGDTLAAYLGERRAITWSLQTRNDLEIGIPEPTEADLQAYHQENAALFTRPESKRITYAWLTPEMIVDTVEIDDQSLRDAYELRFDEFNQPERRMVDRLVFPSEDDAAAAADRVALGTVSFSDLVSERGLQLSDTDMGVVTARDLGDNSDAIFAGLTGHVIGPVETNLGPALFRINAILEAQETTFEDALPQLRESVGADRARRVVESQVDSIDDLLAGGATVEDLAEETDMQVAEIVWNPTVSDDIAAYEAFRAAAASLTENDFPEVMQLDDGSIYAMRLDETIPPELAPLEDVRDEVVAGWENQTYVELLVEKVTPLIEEMRDGKTFEGVDLAVTGTQELTRRGFVDNAPADFIDRVFSMDAGEVALIRGPGRVFVLKLDSIQPPDEADEDLTQVIQQLRNEAAGTVSRDYLQILATDIRSRAGIEIDEAAINAVHLNFQ